MSDQPRDCGGWLASSPAWPCSDAFRTGAFAAASPLVHSTLSRSAARRIGGPGAPASLLPGASPVSVPLSGRAPHWRSPQWRLQLRRLWRQRQRQLTGHGHFSRGRKTAFASPTRVPRVQSTSACLIFARKSRATTSSSQRRLAREDASCGRAVTTVAARPPCLKIPVLPAQQQPLAFRWITSRSRAWATSSGSESAMTWWKTRSASTQLGLLEKMASCGCPSKPSFCMFVAAMQKPRSDSCASLA
mmetsp:Transcript_55340/g.159104  ORF Transcript_55340/g.159104 Transcript_55340/m.159104 type:complete len:246 (-) Transcript_55340:936-1673(-)